MLKNRIVVLIILLIWVGAGVSRASVAADAFTGQDLHLKAPAVTSWETGDGVHLLVFREGFSMWVAGQRFRSQKAVVWVEPRTEMFRGRKSTDYRVRVYMEGDVSVEQPGSGSTLDIDSAVIEQGKAMFSVFEVTGQVFLTADERKSGDPRQDELYQRASKIELDTTGKFVVQAGAKVPMLEKAQVPGSEKKSASGQGAEEKTPLEKENPQGQEESDSSYPVNIAPAYEKRPQLRRVVRDDGTEVITLIGRFYMWQRQDEKGRMLQLEADNAVIFSAPDKLKVTDEQAGGSGVMARGSVESIYMSGDVVLREGPRTVRADEIFYNFRKSQALAVKGEMRTFDRKRSIPIYVRADKLRQLSRSKFTAENVVLTTSEFYLPQLSVTASDIIVTDNTSVEEPAEQGADSNFDARMRDIRVKLGERTIFRWPELHSDLQRPDLPIKSVHIGNDSTWGTSLETRWYLYRMLGWDEPEGTDSTLALDYFSKRGFGTGVVLDYKRENYFGEINGYIINDEGEDRLGRENFRKDLDPERDLRGKFQFRHRQFLPHNWQLTAGLGYESDENFREAYNRREYNIGLDTETYLHMKRIEDNWGLSLLVKGRINDFADQLEELPSGEFHLAGESLFDDRFTLYSDSEVKRLRQRIGDDHNTQIDENFFTFVSHRTELDLPLWVDTTKVVPFVAGNFGYDDRSGFTRSLINGKNTGQFGESEVWIAEAGIRLAPRPLWKVYPQVKSQLWDINKLRHIIEPEVTAVLYEESDDVVKQRNVLNVGLSQRLQTRRNTAGGQRMVNWMRLDMDFTWVNDSDDGVARPDRFMWNNPMVPFSMSSGSEIFNDEFNMSKLRRFGLYGLRRNYFNADYTWLISDTTALVSDASYDMLDKRLEQFNIGFSRLVWPDLSCYVGSRYLRSIDVLDERGSNAMVLAATYKIDPRYTLVLSQQFDTDYGANVRSDLGIIRRYHRLYYGISYSADSSLDDQCVMFSIWPQGVPEVALGERKYIGLDTLNDY